MRAPEPTSADRPSPITRETIPPIICNQPDDIAEVTALEEFRLHVRFNDGTEGHVDMSALIHSPQAGVFAQLADPGLFSEAFVECGAVTWPGELDLAPDAMYWEFKRHGEWKLT